MKRKYSSLSSLLHFIAGFFLHINIKSLIMPNLGIYTRAKKRWKMNSEKYHFQLEELVLVAYLTTQHICFLFLIKDFS